MAKSSFFALFLAPLLVLQLCSAFSVSASAGGATRRLFEDDKGGHHGGSHSGSKIEVKGDGNYHACAGDHCEHSCKPEHCPKPRECYKAICNDYYKCDEKILPDGSDCKKDYKDGKCYYGECVTCHPDHCPKPPVCYEAYCDDYYNCAEKKLADGTKCDLGYGKHGKCYYGECVEECHPDHCPKPQECHEAYCDDYYKCQERKLPDGTHCTKDYKDGKCYYGVCETCHPDHCPEPPVCYEAYCDDYYNCAERKLPDGTKCDLGYGKHGKCYYGYCKKHGHHH